MIRMYANTELRTNGESRLSGTSLRLDTAAAKLRAGYEQSDNG
jgi:hypothetical protein